MIDPDGYRPNVGIVLMHEDGRVFWARRVRRDGWQFPQGGMNTEVQAVKHPSRVHLDIETDDMEAEIARLKSLGATEVVRIRTWVVMEAPTGHRFCVITAQTPDFEARATTWP